MINGIIPFILCIIVVSGLCNKVNVFDIFLEGAKEGLSVCVTIIPPMIGLLTAIGMFKASGGIDILGFLLAPIADLIALPQELIPLAIIRPISGSGALAIFEDVIKSFGADSYVGLTASVMQGATETTFYTIALYFGVTKVKKIRHTAVSSLAADVTGFIVSGMVVRWLFF